EPGHPQADEDALDIGVDKIDHDVVALREGLSDYEGLALAAFCPRGIGIALDFGRCTQHSKNDEASRGHVDVTAVALTNKAPARLDGRSEGQTCNQRKSADFTRRCQPRP